MVIIGANIQWAAYFTTFIKSGEQVPDDEVLSAATALKTFKGNQSVDLVAAVLEEL